MRYRHSIWGMLEQWNPMVFFTAGGLFALLSGTTGLHAVGGTAIALSPVVIFIGVFIVFVGLLGLYPGVADRAASLATVAIGLLGGTVAMLLPAFVVFTSSTEQFVDEATALAILIAVAVGATLTVTTFGIAIHRAGTDMRPIGSFLLLMAASMSSMIFAMVVYGHSTPAWISPVVNGVVAISLGAIGFVLRTEAITTVSSDSTSDIPVG